MDFSEAVKENPSLLLNFNSLDFSNQTTIKYVDGNCQFSNQIFNT
jgi:hypothetical protein